MRRSIRVLGVAALAALLVVGCAKPPDDLVQKAKAALQAAEAAGAPAHAPAAWDRAKQAMARLEAELAKQADKTKFLRRYGPARKLAEQVTSAANQALAETSTKTAQLRAEVSKTIQDLRASLASARSQLSAFARSAAAELAGRLDTAGRRLDQAQADLDAGRIDAALLAASEAREQITAVLRTVEQQTGRPISKKR